MIWHLLREHLPGTVIGIFLALRPNRPSVFGPGLAIERRLEAISVLREKEPQGRHFLALDEGSSTNHRKRSIEYGLVDATERPTDLRRLLARRLLLAVSCLL